MPRLTRPPVDPLPLHHHSSLTARIGNYGEPRGVWCVDGSSEQNGRGTLPLRSAPHNYPYDPVESEVKFPILAASNKDPGPVS